MWGWACEHGVVDDDDLLEPETVICHECGAEVPAVDGARHAYVPAVVGCWTAFTQTQADELRRWGRALAHGVVVDSYMAQHPGDGSDLVLTCYLSDDFQEGVHAFLEKRPANWKGH